MKIRFRHLLVWALIVFWPPISADQAEPRKGRFELQASVTDILGAEAAAGAAHVLPVEEPVSWEIYVPENYEPDRPAGLIVYISPTHSGVIPWEWQAVLEEHNLLWVAANSAGNSVDVQRRALFALIAPDLMRKHYSIDRARVYVSGLSGGGKMASMVATDFAHVFKGAIYNCGVEFWDKKPRRLEAIRQNRYVFVTGEYDQALRPTRRTHERYRKAGVENVKLMVIPGMGHENPDRKHFAEAIEFLDG